MTDDAVEVLERVEERLLRVLGSLSKGMTEEDFQDMERQGLRVNRKLIRHAQCPEGLRAVDHTAGD